MPSTRRPPKSSDYLFCVSAKYNYGPLCIDYSLGITSDLEALDYVPIASSSANTGLDENDSEDVFYDVPSEVVPDDPQLRRSTHVCNPPSRYGFED